MTAVDDFITNLQQNRISALPEPMRGDIDLFIAALQELNGGGASGIPLLSTGRLALQTGVPVAQGSVTSTTLFFTPYVGDKALLYNGTSFIATPYTEPTLDISALDASSVYDIFIGDDGLGSLALAAAKWTDDTTRAIAVSRVGGILLNDSNIAGGPAAQRGTYLGTLATDATPDSNIIFGGVGAAGGEANRIDIWNMYNRERISVVNYDNTNSWANADTTGTRWRVKNASLNNGISFVTGQPSSSVRATNTAWGTANANGTITIGVVLDPTVVTATLATIVASSALREGANAAAAAAVRSVIAEFCGMVTPGRHVLAAAEFGEVGGVMSGDDGSPLFWRGNFTLEHWY